MTRTLLLCLLAVLCSGCERTPPQPKAQLTYLKFERVNLGLYVITYSSDMDLLNVFDRAAGDGQLATLLTCAVDGDPDFTVEHMIERTLSGVIGISGKTPGPPYIFQTLSTFDLNYNEKSSSRPLPLEELSRLLRERDEISCTVSITVFGYKAYYSNPLKIPTRDIIKEVEREPRIWIKGAGSEYLPPELKY
ncbi:hypothetical protein [Pseudomonas sp. NPDC089406]|uniref:hypothetical protein n=1 Tax=Pseudomonas sp. NPDC089406 TaxID=3364463 RepID=UPI00384BEDE9